MLLRLQVSCIMLLRSSALSLYISILLSAIGSSGVVDVTEVSSTLLAILALLLLLLVNGSQSTPSGNEWEEGKTGLQLIGASHDCRVMLNILPSLQATLIAVVQSSNLIDEVEIALGLLAGLSLLCNPLRSEYPGDQGKEGKTGVQVIGRTSDCLLLGVVVLHSWRVTFVIAGSALAARPARRG